MQRVLVVDDLLADRTLAGRLLEKSSEFEVLYAENGIQALDEIEAHIPDIVVTDLMMPEMDGLELVQRVRKDYPLIPVVLMTFQGSEEIAVEALQKGAASYVPKRTLANDLVDTVQQVLSTSREGRGKVRLRNRIELSEDRMTLENDVDLFSAAVQYLEQRTVDFRICNRSDGVRVGVALHEALLNACYHGNFEIGGDVLEDDPEKFHQLAETRAHESPYKDRRIRVNACFSPTEAVYVIRDEGNGFDLGSIPDPTDPTNVDRPSGRGILLMRIFMDEVNYSDEGNEVTLVKRHGSDMDDDSEADDELD